VLFGVAAKKLMTCDRWGEQSRVAGEVPNRAPREFRQSFTASRMLTVFDDLLSPFSCTKLVHKR
jgi:hypothetical protein